MQRTLYRIRTASGRILAEYITQREALDNYPKAREAQAARRPTGVTITEDLNGRWLGDYRSERKNFR